MGSCGPHTARPRFIYSPSTQLRVPSLAREGDNQFGPTRQAGLPAGGEDLIVRAAELLRKSTDTRAGVIARSESWSRFARLPASDAAIYRAPTRAPS